MESWIVRSLAIGEHVHIPTRTARAMDAFGGSSGVKTSDALVLPRIADTPRIEPLLRRWSRPYRERSPGLDRRSQAKARA